MRDAYPFFRYSAYVYFFLEACWMILWFVAAVLIETQTDATAFFQQSVIILHAFHFALLPIVLYARDDGEKTIFVGFLAVLCLDVVVLLFVIYQETEAPAFPWASPLTLAVGIISVCISGLAFLWYLIAWAVYLSKKQWPFAKHERDVELSGEDDRRSVSVNVARMSHTGYRGNKK
jgi:hypothetical protein